MLEDVIVRGTAPACPYCSSKANLVGGEVVYPHRPDLRPLKFWKCSGCRAYVGCHKQCAQVGHTPEGARLISDGTLPLGRLANARLRDLKKKVHAAFDPHWKDLKKFMAHPAYSPKAKRDAGRRSALYAWLATEMQMSRDKCHFGMFNEAQCEQAIAVCNQLQRKETP